MAFRFLVLALTLAYANAGQLLTQPEAVHYSSAPAVSSSYFQQASAPVAYAKAYAAPAVTAYHSAPAVAVHSSPVAVHAPSVGVSQQSVARSLGGAQSVSTYSKAVDSAFSSVRKYDTRITNDALSYAPAQVAYSAPLVTKAYAAPVAYSSPAHLSYAAPAQVSYSAPTQVSYSAPTQVAYASHAPVAYAAPAQLAYTAHAPVVAKAYSPALSYAAQAPLVAKTYAAPATYSYAAPVVAKATYAAAGPVAHYAPGPVVTKAAVAYSPAGVVAHTNFQGYGIEYHY
ncbi:unnamed protein product [Ceutorhynchus assimilis]|uniref:Uncharacterized protein n=1 Tax=Ceutorhynchus assimilis TaxID=467358 RepID=A0A9N9QC56_9CUCU|nr:unnamed protein product [Ceutorhynchus assimilis]